MVPFVFSFYFFPFFPVILALQKQGYFLILRKFLKDFNSLQWNKNGAKPQREKSLFCAVSHTEAFC